MRQKLSSFSVFFTGGEFFFLGGGGGGGCIYKVTRRDLRGLHISLSIA